MAKDKRLYDALKHYFGFDKFKGNQEMVIQNVLQGNDTFVLMPTGGGKSLCFQLPALMMPGTAIVVSPLISLMKNQVDAIRELTSEADETGAAKDASLAHFMNSTLTKQELVDVQSDVLEGRAKLLYVAPETLTKKSNIEFFSKMNVSFYAIDEAHCISEWGHDFRKEYREIRTAVNEVTLRAAGISPEDVARFLALDKIERARLLANHFNFEDFKRLVISMQSKRDKNELAEVFDLLFEEETRNDSGSYTVDSIREIVSSKAATINADSLSELGPDLFTESHDEMCNEVVAEIQIVLACLDRMVKALSKRPPIVALTATATDKVRLDIKKILDIVDANEYKSSFNRPNLYYEVRPKTSNVDKEIFKFIKNRPKKSGIIYCLSRKEVERLAQMLQTNGIKAAAYHAGMEPADRSKTQDDFLMERVKVIVATIAFGMGIDKPDVRFVIHYDIPKSLEGYYQETGRAGRDGGEGHCLAFYSHDDLRKLEKFMEDKSDQHEKDIGRQLLKETATYAESSICRRKLLLHYFGEEYTEDNCGNCDNCKNPKLKVEAKDQLCNIIEIVLAIKENFSEDHVLDIIMGRDTDAVTRYGHNDLELFGIGEGTERTLWKSVISQAVIAEYLEKDKENQGSLLVTKQGKKYFKKPVDFKITLDNDFDEDDTPEIDPVGGNSAVDPVLYQMLVDLRNKVAKEVNKPPYIIFQDQSLEAMATTYPITDEELQNIAGVGAGKVKKYGKAFCELIKRHCEENDIDRPEDFRIRTVANKSKLKISIIQSIDRKVDLDDYAEANKIDFFDLLDEIDSIVYSGTKINIDYFIEQVIEPEKVTEICEYFDESETDDIDKALEELGDDYYEEEIRLVRIKYMSDNAN